jgi:hypothetical protein
MKVQSLAFAFPLVAACAAQAAITSVTGGDAGEGLTLNPSLVVRAYDIGGTGTTTLQGVAFTPAIPFGSDPQISVSGSTAPGGPDLPGASADDLAINAILENVSYNTNVNNIAISGLSPSTEYIVQVLVGYPSGTPRPQKLTLNGVDTGDSVNASVGVSLFTNTVLSDNAGALYLQFDTLAGIGEDNNPIFNAVIVSAVPEPATLGLFAIAALPIATRRRRQHA